MNDIILSTQNGEPVASSRDVAKRFEKRHDHVMRDIEEILKGLPKNGDTPMFFKSEYTHPQNHQKYPRYLMNRDGFSLLAMGFTGKEAVQWKLKYIEAFNQMEKQLAAQHKEQRAVQDANIQNAIDRVIEARKKLDENTAFLDECRKNREDSKQAVFTGDITTYKEYQELVAQLKAEKERADAAEAHLEAANADINGLAERVQKAETERDKARADQLSTAKDCNRLGLKVSQEKDRADKAEARAKDAENQLSGSRQVAEAAKLRADKLQEENAALKKQPIAAVVDEEEVERRAKALAHQWDKEELDRLVAEKAWGLADARNSELAKDNTALRKQLATLQARANDNTQADFETANYCASLFSSAWDTCKGSYSRLTGEDLESTFQTLCSALNSIMEEASLLCRQPADYDGGAADEPDV